MIEDKEEMGGFYDYITENIYFIKLNVYDYSGYDFYRMTYNGVWIDIEGDEYNYAKLYQDIIWGHIDIKRDHCE